jgi:hypothetical protein
MKKWGLKLWLAACLMGLLPLQASALQLRQDDMTAIQSAVQSQIDALVNDDADIAFELATPSTRTRLGTPDNFLRIIKEQYDPVYRHRLALYSDPKVIEGNVFQTVRLTDLDNRVWVAIYLMHKDEKGQWKIEGCQLVETPVVSV